MIFRIVGGVGALLAIVATLLKISAIALPNFVDVHIVSDLNDVAEANRIAQVGVYQSILDTTQEPQLAIANEAGIGPLKIEASSTEFKVLFPAQENFAADLNPLDLAAVEQINGLIEQATGIANVGNSLTDEIEAVEGLGFDNCEGYFDDYIAAQAAVFNAFTTDVLPAAVITISGLLSQEISKLAAGLTEAGLTEGLRGFSVGVTQGTFAGLAASPGNDCTGVAITTELSAGRACGLALGGFMSAGGVDNTFSPTDLGAVVFEAFNDPARALCTDTDTIESCINSLGLEWAFGVNTTLTAPPVFTGLDFCDLTGKVGPACSVIALLQFGFDLATAAVASGALDEEQAASAALLLQGVGLHLKALGLNQVANLADIVDGDNNVVVAAAHLGTVVIGVLPNIEQATIELTDLPDTLFPEPCGVLNVALDVPNCTDIGSYFSQVGPVIEQNDPDTFAQVESILDLYNGCFALGLPAQGCGQVGANAVAAEVFGVNTTESVNLEADLIAECEEDEVDKEKVGEAQVWVAVSSALGMLGLLVILVSLCLSPGVSMFTFGCGGFLALVAGITIFVALAVVASAPVFEGVGEPPAGDEAEIVFVAGIVGKLAVADGALHIVAGLTCFVAACLSFTANKNESESAGVYEGKEDKPVAAQGEDMEDKL